MNNEKSIANLNAEPDASSIHVQSIKANEYFIMNAGWNQARNSIAMNAIIDERDNAETYQQQQKVREETKVNGKRNRERVECIFKSQAELRMKFIESNDFIRACSEKEEIAKCRIAAENELKKCLQKEIMNLEMKIQNLKRFHGKFTNSINDLKAFEQVLDEVVEKMEIFKSKEEFIDRCDAFLLAQTTVRENDESNLKSIEKVKFEMVKLSNDAVLIIAGLENELNSLQEAYEKSSAECLKWENILVPTKNIIGEKERSAFMRLDRIHQLYILLCNRSGVEPEFRKNQVEQQLDFINNEIETLQKMIEMSNEVVAIETSSDIAKYGSNRSEKARK